jgi:Tol biopolymer transport system component
MNRDGSEQRRVLAHRHFAGSPHSLSWSPDGSAIAFESSSAPDCTGVAVVELTTTAVRRLTTCTGPFRLALAPSWKPAAGGEMP